MVGVDPDQVNRADQIRANMRACQGKQNALLKKLGVDSLDLNRIKQKLARCASAKQKKSMLVAIKRIAKIAELERNQQEELQQTNRRLEEQARSLRESEELLRQQRVAVLQVVGVQNPAPAGRRRGHDQRAGGPAGSGGQAPGWRGRGGAARRLHTRG